MWTSSSTVNINDNPLLREVDATHWPFVKQVRCLIRTHLENSFICTTIRSWTEPLYCQKNRWISSKYFAHSNSRKHISFSATSCLNSISCQIHNVCRSSVLLSASSFPSLHQNPIHGLPSQCSSYTPPPHPPAYLGRRGERLEMCESTRELFKNSVWLR